MRKGTAKGKAPGKQVSKSSGQLIPINDLIGQAAFKLSGKDIVHLDDRKRIALGRIEPMGDGYRVYVNDIGQILLDPVAAIPLREVWLHRNPSAKAKVEAGLTELASGNLGEGPDLSQYRDDDA